MVTNRGVIFWDFDGTLVHFTSWRMALMDVLNEYEPGHNIDDEWIRPFLRDSFPWHRPEEPHPQLNNPDLWWQALDPVFVRCFQGLGYGDERAGELASQVRRHMIKHGRYVLYDDTVPVMAELKKRGWRQIILSNHMPELPQVIDALGLSPYLDLCLTSGITGYEKPNIRAFQLALSLAGNPEQAWMVGDNMVSDIKGAEAVGIPAILVNIPHVHSNQVADIRDIRYQAVELTGVVKIIEENSR